MGMTKTTLRPAANGVGYKALFMGSDAIKGQVASYGYSLQLEGCNAITRTKEGFVSNQELSLLLKNYDVENFGETNLNAKVILILTDGTVIESAEYTTTLKDMVESVNANIDLYSAEQIKAVQEMLSGYELDWDISNITNYA